MNATTHLVDRISDAARSQPHVVGDLHATLKRIPEIARQSVERAARQRAVILAGVARHTHDVTQIAAAIQRGARSHRAFVVNAAAAASIIGGDHAD